MTYHYYQNKAVLIIILIAAMSICGCRDVNKGERVSLRTQIDRIEADLPTLKEEQAQASRESDALASEIKLTSETLLQHQNRQTKLKDELALYILDHKMTTAVLAMTAASVAAVVNENADQETKDQLTGLGVLGIVAAVAYCYNYAEECASVTAKVAFFGSQLQSEKNTISTITAELSQKKSQLQQRQSKYASLAETIAKKSAERQGLQQKHDSLVCTFCI